MSLLYKPDWEEAQQRYRAWWAGEAMDRCAIWVTAPRDGVPKADPPHMPDDPIRRWTDLDYISRLNDFEHSRTFYGGEAFPIWHPGYPGLVFLPTFLGCPISLDHETGWHAPILTEADWDVRSLKFDKDGRWWKFGLELLRRSVRESCGKSIPSIGAFGGCGDTLAALRGSERLLHDVLDCPDRVREAEFYLMDLWIETYNTYYEIIRDTAEGSAGWFSLWSPGRFYAAQCDFSYMISPKMFRDIFLPVVERQTQFLDHTVYHVDGIEAFRHIPALCELPRLQAIQVLPGAGKPSPLHYMDSLKIVQAAHKNLWIDIPAGEVKQALAALSARGLYIETFCRTEAEAQQLLEDAKKWSRNRKV
jgi:5-methyltetrahydrofolate--homocysteine methyltransferase